MALQSHAIKAHQELPVLRSGMFWLAIIIFATAAGVLVFNRQPSHGPIGNRACYSDDDGATWFVDDSLKVVPFDHNGKPAYKAFVYTYDDGNKKYIAGLMRYSENGQKILNDAIAKANASNKPLGTLELTFAAASLQEIKLPGPGNPWVPLASKAGNTLLKGSPDGSPIDVYLP